MDDKPSPPCGRTLLIDFILAVLLIVFISALHFETRSIKAITSSRMKKTVVDDLTEHAGSEGILPLLGKWVSPYGDGTTLEFTDTKLTFARGGRILFQCGYDAKSYSPGIALWLRDTKGAQVMSGWPSRPFDWLIYYRATGKQLEIWGGPDFLPFLLDRMKPIDLTIVDSVRFIRPVEGS